MKAIIVYQSRTGKTAFYAREMAMYLWQKGVSVSLCSTADFKTEKLDGCDLLLIGCWTSGWILFHQHPGRIWTDFADKNLQRGLPSRILLFTTYKFRTGRMFKNMMRHIHMERNTVIDYLYSKTGVLTEKEKSLMNKVLKEISE